MNLTPYHARYFAYDLTRRASSGLDRLSMSLFDAAVDMNPHQIEAALFALESPLSKGVLLADEVGLGKTIEDLGFNDPKIQSRTDKGSDDADERRDGRRHGLLMKDAEPGAAGRPLRRR